jgi:hypothetical protein
VASQGGRKKKFRFKNKLMSLDGRGVVSMLDKLPGICYNKL